MGRIRQVKLENQPWNKSERDSALTVFWGKGNKNI